MDHLLRRILMRSCRFLVVLFATVLLTACLNSTTLVKLKPDGSGTVEQTTLVNVAALKGLGANAQSTAPMTSREELERTAARMGKGVKLLSNEPVKGDNGFEGTRAIFAFEDINQVEISQDPNVGAATGSSKQESPVKFNFSRNGGTSTLTIDITDRARDTAKKETSAPPAGDMPDLTNPMIMGMIKSMFQGFKVNIDLEVVGSIVKTNAEYVSGSRITMLEVDMVSLLADEAKLKALQGKIGPDASFSDIKPYLKDINGIKIDGPSISVQFK
jgi:hypothetical protein